MLTPAQRGGLVRARLKRARGALGSAQSDLVYSGAFGAFGLGAFGAEEADAGGGGGGGGAGQAVGAVAGAAAAIAGVVAAGVMNEDRPEVAYRRARDRWSNADSGLERSLHETDKLREERDDRKKWLCDKDNWKKWKADNPRANSGPGGCSSRDKGGNCRWSAHPKRIDHPAWCAYKDPVKAEVTWNEAKLAQALVEQALWFRPGLDLESPNLPNTGSVKGWRLVARKHFDVIVGLEPYRLFFTALGIVLEPAPTHLFLKGSLQRLYPEAELAEDVDQGVLPFITRNNILSTALSLKGAHFLGDSVRLPLWVYGFTLDEQRDLGPIGPTLGAVESFVTKYTPQAFDKKKAATTGVFSGVPNVPDAFFGAVAQEVVVSPADSMKAWIQEGAPSTWQGQLVGRDLPAGATLTSLDNSVVADAELGEEPPTRWWVWAAGTGAVGTVVGGTVWALRRARRVR